MRYYLLVIKSFHDRRTERLFSRERVPGLPHDFLRVAWRKLAQLDAVDALEDLRISPGNRLERLKGDRDGQHSIRVNDQWRICFLWQQGDAYRVELVDYH